VSATAEEGAVRVAEIMQTDLLCCPPETGVADAAAAMTRRSVGACLVVSGGLLRGIFTERDLLRLVGEREAGLAERRLDEVMTAQVSMAPPDAELVWAGAEMKRLGVRHLPVGEGGRPIGIVSLRDLYAVAESVLRLDPRGVDHARRMLSSAGDA
jgi:CBS domain-containing protein